MPFALGNTIYGFTQGKLDLNESLKIGNFVFQANSLESLNFDFTDGRTWGNSILLNKHLNFSHKEVLSHELIHVYQYESFTAFNSYLDKSLHNLNKKNKWARRYHKIFYTDFNYLSFQVLYSLYTDHNTNFFEKEARFYTKRD